MKRLGITNRQKKYAYHVMNTDTTKKEALLASGYSEAIAHNPHKVENSNGYKLAMAGIFAKTGNVAMTLLNELEVRDMKKETTENIVKFFDVMTKAMERIAPKQKDNDSDVSKIFSGIINGDTEESLTDDVVSDDLTDDETVSLTDIANDSIVKSIE
jgi:hypothetical protein